MNRGRAMAIKISLAASILVFLMLAVGRSFRGASAIYCWCFVLNSFSQGLLPFSRQTELMTLNLAVTHCSQNIYTDVTNN
jgi:hypothetical protein